ncbi:MAG TPA: hypothetical protein VH475_05250 [Tepidisphaeraceae bacterium]|jgi:hypothetical protein
MVRLLGLCCLSLVMLPLSGGCSVLGYVAAVVPGPPTKARYAGLAGQKVAVMTWAERAVTFDFSLLQSDVSMAVHTKLQQAADPNVKTEELVGTTFVDPRQAYRFQKNHPELENKSLIEIAPKVGAALGCTRLIWVELQPFSIYDPRTPVLLKGYTTATIRVAEIAPGGGGAKIVYEEAGVSAEFPKNAGEGVPPSDSMTPQYIYKGLVDEITTQVALRFMTNPSE